ncbi:hypothetical protein GCM10010211_01530 [Streptomyces albospinus]|uniref:Peptidoglycan binding domain-containing protein n=1 Tax=Streptomyces albospinus TaxID=285515 RepID=A0ABQ2UMR8_9ACTN|nr:hypothetical protein [Streptomyces albospinus]GGU42094.1 hypothetical protein GCM10010211_01530 [Streptomyces albospinus]
MSRESDSSSSGPQGRGGAAYPSGTPPYGSPRGEAGEGLAPGAAAQPEEPKTETTLTTRIKINIPGSRPIPPVVVRKPVGEESGMNASAASGGSAGPSGPPGGSRPAFGGERNAERTGNTPRPEAADKAPGGAPGDKTSDWFAPRKPQSGPGGQSSTTGTHAAPPAPESPAAPGSASGAKQPQRPDLPYFSDVPTAPRGGATPFDGGRERGGSPYEPDPLAGNPLGGDPLGSDPLGGDPLRSDPLGGNPFDGGSRGGASPFDGGSPFDAPAKPARDRSPFDSPLGGPAGPSGPTTGPARGDSALNLPPGFSDPSAGKSAAAHRTDDTAELTPQPPAPLAGPGGGLGVSGGLTGGRPNGAPGGPKGTGPGKGGGPGGRVSGDTLVSGIPKVPGGQGPKTPSPFAAGAAAGGEDESAAPKPRPKIPEPINSKKGRSKLVLAGAGVVVLAAVAYGAGLLLDHADVPNNTTALGVDIGGTSKEDAVKRLESGLKGRRTAPLKLTVDGKPETLLPATAGLDIDLQATVRNAAGRDYNPVSVIGSLFGVKRTAQPAMITDKEKLQVALENVAGPAGASKDGGITFENGKAVPHYGAPYKAIDVAASQDKIVSAYLDRAGTGTDTPVVLAATTQQPKVSKDAVDKALKEFAEPAMSGLVTIRADARHAVSFSPQKSIPKFLSFKIINGQLVPYYDRPALKELYGTTFEGVLVAKGDGTKHPVSVEEVANAVGKALVGKTPAERVQTIATNGS